ncbi:hypothetical protein B9479_008101 [Cryptococcus floricola]|uniref:Uncharacterized protein n=1 Tax=Cryptococcus floricola TaxID=2591691 RepID=A0A5D3ANV8_9TREE|nr:hypothetical protein B9479_008101 [Cryptococcus floricola]
MSLDLSTFPPNSHYGDFSNAYIGHMCYCPMHLDLPARKSSAAGWVGSGKPITTGTGVGYGTGVNVVKFEKGTFTVLCGGCGISAVGCSLGDPEPDHNKRIIGTAKRKHMDPAGIYDDYRNTFQKAVSVQSGAINAERESHSFWGGDPEFGVVRNTMTNQGKISNAYVEFAESQPMDMSRFYEGEEWRSQDWKKKLTEKRQGTIV